MIAFLIILCLGLFGLALCLSPGIIAFMRGHPSAFAILLVSLFFGWTVVGWILALVWAFTNPARTPTIIVQNGPRVRSLKRAR